MKITKIKDYDYRSATPEYNKLREQMIDDMVCSEDELSLVEYFQGYGKIDVLNDILYYKTGYRDVYDYFELLDDELTTDSKTIKDASINKIQSKLENTIKKLQKQYIIDDEIDCKIEIEVEEDSIWIWLVGELDYEEGDTAIDYLDEDLKKLGYPMAYFEAECPGRWVAIIWK